MRKIFCCFAVFLMIGLVTCAAVADVSLCGYDGKEGYQYVTFGRFPQTAQGKVQPIVWRVLEADTQSAYLLSEYILFNNRIHPDDNEYIAFGGAFNQTEIYALLNGPFERVMIPEEGEEYLRRKGYYGRAYDAEICFLDQAFTAQEQAYLVSDDALGKVFLPTAGDLKNGKYGFVSSNARRGYGTQFALAGGLFQYSNGSSPYWTRTQSDTYAYAARCTKQEGKLGYIRCVVMNEGCRPAIRLALDNLTLSGGRGTRQDPFVFAMEN